MSTTFPTRRHQRPPQPTPKPQPVVVSDATLRRLIATGGRIEAPPTPPKVA